MNPTRLRALALALLLLSAGPIRADDRYVRPAGGFGRVAGRPDRDEILAGARPYAASRPVDDVAPRPYERRPAPPAEAPPRPHRSTAAYFPGQRPNQYANHTPRFAHCTPARGHFIGDR